MEIKTKLLVESYAQKYVADVKITDLTADLNKHFNDVKDFAEDLNEAIWDFRYQPGKWTVKQLLGHIADSRVIFAYRFLAFTRGETKQLPGFEEVDYVTAQVAEKYTTHEIEEQLSAGAAVWTAFSIKLDPVQLQHLGDANGILLTSEEVCRLLIGHERHHIEIVKERYLPEFKI